MAPPPIEPARVAAAQIPRVYSRVAPVYDLWGHLTESNARARALALAAVRDGEDVLEVAVGTGLAFEQLVRANPRGRTEGVDVTEAMMARAAGKVRDLPGTHPLTLADARALPFADASFDLLLNNYMFDLLPEADFEVVLAQMRRVLRTAGRLVLVNMAVPAARRHALYLWLYRRAPELMGGCRPVALAPHLERAGFAVITREYVSQLGFPSEVILALPG